MPLVFDDQDLEDTRRQNRRLAKLPRVRLRGIQRTLMQGLFGLIAPLITNAMRRKGVSVDNRTVSALGRTVDVQILRAPGPVNGLYLEIHGGGWTIGRAFTNGKENVAIAKSGVVVVAVDYRLAPTVPFATVLDDCETAARWALESGLKEFGVDGMVIGGDSAGGHLAAITALRLRGSPHFEKLKGAMLLYGCFDLGGTDMVRNAGKDTLLLHGPTLMKVMDTVTRGMSVEARRAPDISPFYADLHGMPPAIFIVGTGDPLLDDSKMMHAKWSQTTSAELVVVPEAAHGFNHFESRAGDKVNAYIRQWISARLAARLPMAAAS
jgi:acetyl esterase/lipase